VLQLNLELQQRAKWEAVRLSEVVEQYEREWVGRFDDFAASAKAQAQAEARSAIDAEQERLQVRAPLLPIFPSPWRPLHNELLSSHGFPRARSVPCAA
jgi:hypothetical protein